MGLLCAAACASARGQFNVISVPGGYIPYVFEVFEDSPVHLNNFSTGGPVGVWSNASLSIGGDVTVGLLTNHGTVSVAGTLEALPGSNPNLSWGLFGTIFNYGTIVRSGSTSRIKARLLNNSELISGQRGVCTLQGGDEFVRIQNAGTLLVDGAVTVSGSFTHNGYTYGTQVDNRGTISVADSLTVLGDMYSSGTLLASGTLASRYLFVSDGTVSVDRLLDVGQLMLASPYTTVTTNPLVTVGGRLEAGSISIRSGTLIARDDTEIVADGFALEGGAFERGANSVLRLGYAYIGRNNTAPEFRPGDEVSTLFVNGGTASLDHLSLGKLEIDNGGSVRITGEVSVQDDISMPSYVYPGEDESSNHLQVDGSLRGGALRVLNGARVTRGVGSSLNVNSFSLGKTSLDLLDGDEIRGAGAANGLGESTLRVQGHAVIRGSLTTSGSSAVLIGGQAGGGSLHLGGDLRASGTGTRISIGPERHLDSGGNGAGGEGARPPYGLRIDGDFVDPYSNGFQLDVTLGAASRSKTAIYVGGVARLQGSDLTVTLDAGFMPQVGDRFPIVDAGEMQGRFKTFTAPEVSGTSFLGLNYTRSLLGRTSAEVITLEAPRNVIGGHLTGSHAAANDLVVIAHGFNSNASVFQPLATAIRNEAAAEAAAGARQGVPDVVVFDWSDYAGGPRLWNSAAENGVNVGAALGDFLKARGIQYANVQLMAHSAGTWVVNSLSEAIRRDFPATKIQLTLFDSYVPDSVHRQGNAPLTRGDVGGSADFVEQYYHSWDLPDTAVVLPRAVNFDVTSRADWPINPKAGHSFPYVWYEASVAGDPAEYPVMIGFGNSLARTGFVPAQSGIYARGQEVVLPDFDADDPLSGSLFKATVTKTPLSILNSNPVTTGNVQIDSSGATLTTNSPAMLMLLAESSGNHNILRFDAEFTTAAPANLALYVNGLLTREWKSEDFADVGSVFQSGWIPTTGLVSGANSLLFRLDNLTDSQASVKLSNVALGTLVLTPLVETGPRSFNASGGRFETAIGSGVVSADRVTLLPSERASRIVSTSQATLDDARILVSGTVTAGLSEMWFTSSSATGATIVGSGEIINASVIRTMYESVPSGVNIIHDALTVGSGIAISAAPGVEGVIRADAGGTLVIAGSVAGNRLNGFSEIRLEDGGQLGLASGTTSCDMFSLTGSGTLSGPAGSVLKVALAVSATGGTVLSRAGNATLNAPYLEAAGGRVDLQAGDSFGSVAVTHGGVISTSGAVAANVFIVGGSDTLGGNVVLGDDLDVTNGLTLYDGGSVDAGGHGISAGSVWLSGSAAISNLASLNTPSLGLGAGASFGLAGSGSVGSIFLSAGSVLTTSGGARSVMDVSNSGGSLVLGGDLHVANGLFVFAGGSVDAGGHGISAGAVGLSGSATISNLASLDTSSLNLDVNTSFGLTGSGSIGSISLAAGSVLTTSGGDPAVGWISNYGGHVVLGADLNVTYGFTVSAGGSVDAGGHGISAGAVWLSGSTAISNLTSLNTSSLNLDTDTSFWLTGSGSIGSISLAAGSVLTTSSSTPAVGRISNFEGSIVLGGDLNVTHDFYVSAGGSIDAGGHGITAGFMSLEDGGSLINAGRIRTPSLLLLGGSATLNGGTIGSLMASGAIVDLRMDATSSVTTDSTLALSGLSVSPGGVLHLNAFQEDLPVGRVGLRWSGGDHTATLGAYLGDGQITYRAGLGNVAAVYDAETNDTLIIDPFSRKTYSVPLGEESHESDTAAIVGNTAVEKSGSGTLTLSGSNSYYAGTTLVEGRLVAGNATAFGVGEVVVVGGTLDLASLPLENAVVINAGSLVNADNFRGQVTIAGRVSIAGTVGGEVIVFGELSGNGSVFTGPVSVLAAAEHSPGNSPGEQTFADGLSYDFDAVLNWDLAGNTTAGAGTSYDFLRVTGGDLVIAEGAILNLVFSDASSTVTWTDAFWDSPQAWTIIDASLAASSSGIFSLGAVGRDSLGAILATIRPQAGFSVTRAGNDVVLSYSPFVVPEPCAAAMALAGLACGWGSVRRRQRVRRDSTE